MTTIPTTESGLRRTASRHGYTIQKARGRYTLVDAGRNWLVADDLDLTGLAEELSARCKA